MLKITKNGEKQVKESVKVAKQTVSAFEAICTEGSDAKIHVVRGRRGRGAAEAKIFHYYGGVAGLWLTG